LEKNGEGDSIIVSGEGIGKPVLKEKKKFFSTGSFLIKK